MSTKISEEDVLRDMRETAEGLEGPMTTQQYKKHGSYSVSLAAEKFGTWNKAKLAAGLKVNKGGATGVLIKCDSCGASFIHERQYEGYSKCTECGESVPAVRGRMLKLSESKHVRRIAEGPVVLPDMHMSDLPPDVRQFAKTIKVTRSPPAVVRTRGVSSVVYLEGDLRRAVSLFIEENEDFVREHLEDKSSPLRQLLDEEVYVTMLEQWYWGGHIG